MTSHINVYTERWYVSNHNFQHNHEFLNGCYIGMLPIHMKINNADALQISNFRTVGVRPLHMHVSFANSSGGYENVGFVSKDIYNEVAR